MAAGLPTQQPRPPVVAGHPKINARKGAPLCIDCAHHSWSFEWMTGRTVHRCHDVMTRDPVTGAPTDPYSNRKGALSCGPQGSYWRIKPAQPQRDREVRELDDSEPMEFIPPVPVRVLVARPHDELVAELWERP